MGQISAEITRLPGSLLSGNQHPVATSVAGIRSEDGILKLLDVKSEDRILFEKWSGSEVQVNGENLLIVNGK